MSETIAVPDAQQEQAALGVEPSEPLARLYGQPVLAMPQDLYRRVNAEGHTRAAVTCPSCQHEFAVDVSGGRVGES